MQVRNKLMLLMLACSLTACVSAPPDAEPAGGVKKDGRVKIGIAMDTLKEARWQRDKELLEARAKELGAEAIIQVADNKDSEQLKQVESLLAQKVDVLIIVPHNAEVAAASVEAAKKQGVPVISYDRLIKNSDVDLYVSHELVKVGQMQAQYALDHAPKGNYIRVSGAPTDNNATLLRQGQDGVLKDALAGGAINFVIDQPCLDWQPSQAKSHTENGLTKANNNVVAVLAANDGTAGGAISALAEQNLAGKVVVTGQDADLPALQRIVEGTQSMTVYKPIQPLAYSAIDNAIKLAHHEALTPTSKVNNGKLDVPAILQEPVAVEKSNIISTVVKDGFAKLEDICATAKDKCPTA